MQLGAAMLHVDWLDGRTLGDWRLGSHTSKEVGLEINVEKTKYMFLSLHQNVGQNRDIEIANRSFENVSQNKYLGTTVTHQNLIQEGN
jgi:hypothetical protein